jgi:hypothetical protein
MSAATGITVVESTRSNSIRIVRRCGKGHSPVPRIAETERTCVSCCAPFIRRMRTVATPKRAPGGDASAAFHSSKHTEPNGSVATSRVISSAAKWRSHSTKHHCDYPYLKTFEPSARHRRRHASSFPHSAAVSNCGRRIRTRPVLLSYIPRTRCPLLTLRATVDCRTRSFDKDGCPEQYFIR